MVIIKHIIAIMPAYEVFTEDGELRAYKAKGVDNEEGVIEKEIKGNKRK